MRISVLQLRCIIKEFLDIDAYRRRRKASGADWMPRGSWFGFNFGSGGGGDGFNGYGDGSYGGGYGWSDHQHTGDVVDPSTDIDFSVDIGDGG